MNFLKSYPFWFMFSGFYVGDCVTTWIGLTLGHGYEANPVYNYIFSFMGMYLGLFFYKTTALIIVTSVAYCLSEHKTEYSGKHKNSFPLVFWEPIYYKIANVGTVLYFLGFGGFIASIWNIYNLIGVS